MVNSTSLIHPQAIIEDGAVIGKNVKIGPWTHIAANVVIGALASWTLLFFIDI